MGVFFVALIQQPSGWASNSVHTDFAVAATCADISKQPFTATKVLEGEKIQFLGVVGYLIHWRNEGLLIAPHFSNPNFLGLPPVFVKANNEVIDQRMPNAADVTMLLIGHGHYDHLLDVFRIMEKQAPKSIAYGSKSVGHMLRANISPERVVDAEAAMYRALDKGHEESDGWFLSKGGAFRAKAIESKHAPVFAGELMAGSYLNDLDAIPAAIWNWKAGQVLAWLIDLLDDQGQPVYRIHYQDSSAPPPFGLPPKLHDGKSIDVDIISAGSWMKVDQFPEALLKQTKPEVVVIGHWENFFHASSDKSDPLESQDICDLVGEVKAHSSEAQIYVPLQNTYIPLPRFGSNITLWLLKSTEGFEDEERISHLVSNFIYFPNFWMHVNSPISNHHKS